MQTTTFESILRGVIAQIVHEAKTNRHERQSRVNNMVLQWLRLGSVLVSQQMYRCQEQPTGNIVLVRDERIATQLPVQVDSSNHLYFAWWVVACYVSDKRSVLAIKQSKCHSLRPFVSFVGVTQDLFKVHRYSQHSSRRAPLSLAMLQRARNGNPSSEQFRLFVTIFGRWMPKWHQKSLW